MTDGERLQLWDAVMVAAADRPHLPVVLEAGSVLCPPAPPGAVRAAEQRLGVELPASYVDFLSRSDGAYASGCGLPIEPGEYGLVPAAALRPLADASPGHVTLWVDTFGGEAPEPREARADWDDVISFARFGEAVLITPKVDAVCDCLVPVSPELDAGGEGWEVWATFKEGATRFLSFGHWLDRLIESEWVARTDEIARRVVPGVAEQLGVIERWMADPDYHWFAVRQVRRLAALPTDPRVTGALDRLWGGGDPYLHLAATQAELVHRRDLALHRLAELAASAPEPTVALAAAATLRVCDHPALRAAQGS